MLQEPAPTETLPPTSYLITASIRTWRCFLQQNMKCSKIMTAIYSTNYPSTFSRGSTALWSMHHPTCFTACWTAPNKWMSLAIWLRHLRTSRCTTSRGRCSTLWISRTRLSIHRRWQFTKWSRGGCHTPFLSISIQSRLSLRRWVLS